MIQLSKLVPVTSVVLIVSCKRIMNVISTVNNDPNGSDSNLRLW